MCHQNAPHTPWLPAGVCWVAGRRRRHARGRRWRREAPRLLPLPGGAQTLRRGLRLELRRQRLGLSLRRRKGRGPLLAA